MTRICFKIGGEILKNSVALKAIGEDFRKLFPKSSLILIHGAGPQITELCERMGIEKKMVGGRRITDEPTLQCVTMAQSGLANSQLTTSLLAHGIPAVGISAFSGRTIVVVKRPPKAMSGTEGKKIDFGFVGDVSETHTDLIEHLWKGKFVPVVSTLSSSVDGQTLNCNADLVASTLAAALRVDHLVMVTDVQGVLKNPKDPSTRIPRLTRSESECLISSGIISGGMIPKVEEAFEAIGHGVKQVHIVSPTKAGIILQEIQKPGSSGTVLTSS